MHGRENANRSLCQKTHGSDVTLINREKAGTPLVVYVGPFGFPIGGAAAKRVLGNSKAIQSAGYDVIVCTGSPQSNPTSLRMYSGIEVVSINERTSEHLPKLLKHIKYITMGKRTVDWLDALDRKPDAVILYSGYTPYLLRLLRWSKRNRVKIVFDAVEWYQPTSILKYFLPYYVNIEIAMRFLVGRTRNVIAISSYLESYYIKKGCNTILVPPLMDIDPDATSNLGGRANPVVRFSYTGNPGNKDLLANVILSFLKLRASRDVNLSLDIAGVSLDQWLSMHKYSPSEMEDMAKFAHFHGEISHEEAIEMVRNSHFTVLARGITKLSQAGFPTKFVESFSVGTPVVSNLTSDLHRYLQHNKTGIVAKSEAVSDFKSAIEQAYDMPLDQYFQMRNSCQSMAKDCFHFGKYSEVFRDFLRLA